MKISKIRLWHKVFIFVSFLSVLAISAVLGFQTADTWEHLLKQRELDSFYRHTTVVETAKLSEINGGKKLEYLFSNQMNYGNDFCVFFGDGVEISTFQPGEDLKEIVIKWDDSEANSFLLDGNMYILSWEIFLEKIYKIITKYNCQDLYDFFTKQLTKTAVFFVIAAIILLIILYIAIKKNVWSP